MLWWRREEGKKLGLARILIWDKREGKVVWWRVT
jgi:hypothetical protein